jgi:hypothetical protein
VLPVDQLDFLTKRPDDSDPSKSQLHSVANLARHLAEAVDAGGQQADHPDARRRQTDRDERAELHLNLELDMRRAVAPEDWKKEFVHQLQDERLSLDAAARADLLRELAVQPRPLISPQKGGKGVHLRTGASHSQGRGDARGRRKR